jgi:hypothetical protein
MTDLELAIRYKPHLYADLNETIPLRNVGYSILRETGASPSFDRDLNVPQGSFVIEYALFFDFDIQHLYDLEHVWIYVDEKGDVYNIEGSAHGWFFNFQKFVEALEQETHAPLFIQPGKHSLMPRRDFFWLYDNCITTCTVLSGGGLLVPPLLKYLHEELAPMKTPENDAKIDKYIRGNLSFQPTMNFRQAAFPDDILLPWETLEKQIPVRLREILAQI